MVRRGLSLVELLVTLAVGAVLAATLLAGGRWLILSSERVSRRLLARERGERVLSFLEPRVLHAGLGLSSCRISGMLQRALGRGLPGAPVIAGWPGLVRPLQVYRDSGALLEPAPDEGGVYRGSGLFVLFSLPSGVLLRAPGGGVVSAAPGESVKLTVLSGTLENVDPFAGRPRDLRSWFSLPMAGYPVHLGARNGKDLSLQLADDLPDPVTIPPLSELFLLRCERFRVQNNILYFQEMRSDWYPPNFQPRENGVLALWLEWRPASRILDLWVLTSGGPAVFGPSAKPASWPDDAPWRAEFSNHELYVSRASWRSENL